MLKVTAVLETVVVSILSTYRGAWHGTRTASPGPAGALLGLSSNSSRSFHVPHTALRVLCFSLTRCSISPILQKGKLRLRDIK